MNRLFTTLLVSLALANPALAMAEGTAVGVNPDANAQHRGAVRILVVGSDVSVGERVVTGPQGRVQLLFDDQTRIVVGPGSTLEIEAYLLNSSGGADRFAVNALAGTFRFISGTSPKPAYSIDTPTASIAVRGTRFDLTVAGTTSGVMLFEGELTICRGNNCIDLDRRCDIGIVSPSEALYLLWSDPTRSTRTTLFPLPNIQAAFLPDFRIQGSQACLAPPAGAIGQSLATPGAGSSPADDEVVERPTPPPRPQP